jgi:hypothetical protein
MTQTLDIFVEAASSASIKTHLEQQLDALAARYREMLNSIASLTAAINDHDMRFPATSTYQTLIHDVEGGIRTYTRRAEEALTAETLELLREGRDLNLSQFTIRGVLKVTDHTEELADILDRWNSRALVEARDALVGPNLDAAAWQHALNIAARAFPHSGDPFDVEKRTVRLHGPYFSKNFRGNYEANFNYADRFQQELSALLFLAEAIANNTREVRRGLHSIAARPFFSYSFDGFTSAELFKWHPVDAGVVTRFRIYKDSGFVIEFATSDLVQRLKSELEPAIASLGY